MSLRSEWLAFCECFGPGASNRQAFEAGYFAGRQSCACRVEQHAPEIDPAERKRLVGPYDPSSALSAGGET